MNVKRQGNPSSQGRLENIAQLRESYEIEF